MLNFKSKPSRLSLSNLYWTLRIGKQLEEISAKLFNLAKQKSQRSNLVIMTGMTGSGKSYLAYNHPELQNLFVLNQEVIFPELKKQFDFLQETCVVGDKNFRQNLQFVNFVRTQVLEKVINAGVGMIDDFPNLNKLDRKFWLNKAGKKCSLVQLVYVYCSDTDIKSRLRQDSEKLTFPSTNMDLYSLQRLKFDTPKPDECEWYRQVSSKSFNEPILF